MWKNPNLRKNYGATPPENIHYKIEKITITYTTITPPCSLSLLYSAKRRDFPSLPLFIQEFSSRTFCQICRKSYIKNEPFPIALWRYLYSVAAPC